MPVWGMRVGKLSSAAFVFQVYSTIQGKMKAKDFCYFSSKALQSSAGPWPGSKFSKTVKVGYSYSELKPCQREITTDKIQEKKYYRERSSIKSTHVSALTGSLAQCHAKWELRCRRIQHHAGIEPMSPDYQLPALTNQPLFRINWLKKTVNELSYYLKCFTQLFGVQNCRSQTAQVEYQG